MAEPKLIPLEKIRWQLGSIWFVGAGILFLLLMIQSLAGVHEEHVQAVWGWLLPNIIPTLSLMLGVFAASALNIVDEADSLKVRKNFARLAMGLSVFHLLAVSANFIAMPFLPTAVGGRPDHMELFEMSNLWLGPLQGLVAATIGALFFSRQNDTNGGG